jgi:hypothetical protein
MLETNARLTHDDCAEAREAEYFDFAFDGHESITELELCRAFTAYQAHADEMAFQSAAAAERALERAMEEGSGDPCEVYLTAGGRPAEESPIW